MNQKIVLEEKSTIPDTLVTQGYQEIGVQPARVYPHEDINSIAKLNFGREWVEVAKIIGQYVPIVLKSRRAPTAERQSMTFQFVNGDNGAEFLAHKYLFGDLVNKLGYRAPRSVYIQAGTNAEQVQDETLNELSDQKSYFIKPVNGVLGKGTCHFNDLHELARVVSTSHEDYLVQSDETPQEDWRYILHRDADSSDRIWRIAYKKIRPIVIGDGISTIEELVRKTSEIPEDRKSKIIRKISDRTSNVPAEGQITPVAESGNISNGAYGQLPEPEELRRMDSFMQRFVADLEGRLGTKLNTMCFDLGILDTSIFKDEYDFEKMRETVVFYEFQMPFGITGYLDEIYSRTGHPIEKAKNIAKRSRLKVRLAKSALKNLIISR